MNRMLMVGVLLLLASAPVLAQKCPALDITMLNKGFSEVAPWRVVSGGPAECSFMTRSSSVNLGFNHMVARSAEAAQAAAAEMMQAVAPTSVVEPKLSLGESGFTYQPKKENGQVDRTSMFFYGHRGTVGVSGYLNLKDPITPAQRVLAGNLISSTLGIASNPNALAKATNCRYLEPNIVARLLPAGDVSTIVPDANNCVASAGNSVITVAIAKDSRGWGQAERIFKNEGCSVDPLSNAGKGAGIAYHCRTGNPRAEVVVTTGNRWVRVLYAPGAEPSLGDREALAELARFAASR
ncbi:MAG: hypothetical protein ABW276_09335 [Casimicrobiaceae bacterium]